jgi:uncharacterized protein (TIGR02147 family)
VKSQDLRKLVSVENYRDFILAMIELRRATGKRFGYSDIARRARFSARSFPRDVALGTKRLSPRSLAQLSVGLGLKGDLAEYFRILVEIETPDCRVKTQSTEKLENSLKNLRTRILRRSDEVPNPSSQETLPELFSIARIYAALGDPADGASLSEIQNRTGVNKSEIQHIIAKFKKSGLITERHERYFACDKHLSLSQLKAGSDFQKFFLLLLSEASALARADFESSERLFFGSTFSVSRADLPALKSELRSILLRYVDQSESARGNAITSLVCALI